MTASVEMQPGVGKRIIDDIDHAQNEDVVVSICKSKKAPSEEIIYVCMYISRLLLL